MNKYPAWKNALVVIVVLLGVLFSLPNVFGEDPALQISRDDYEEVTQATVAITTETLELEGVPYTTAFIRDNRVLVRFAQVEDQFKAADLLEKELGTNFVVAKSFAPRTPGWLRALGLRPMSLGLDLRGGIHFLYEVDIEGVVDQTLDRYRADFRALFRDERIRFSDIRHEGDAVKISLVNAEDVDAAVELIEKLDDQLLVSVDDGTSEPALYVSMSEQQVKQRQDFAIQQNITTLRNRVNELGVAEPLVQRAGLDRILVQLPGLQNADDAKRLLGKTATLEFRLVDPDNDPYEAERRGRAPLGSLLYYTKDGTPVLLKRDVIVSGENLTDATAGFASSEGPAVFIKLDAKGANKMLDTTRNNLNKPMAVVFIEKGREIIERDGEQVTKDTTEETVINVATIRGVFSSNFQITGLQVLEARDLALLLRAGALAAPIYIVEERTIGPSLGQDNIVQGRKAVMVGFLLVIVFMALYYRVFGLVADLALFLNLVLIVALLSLLQAALTLPGIAGIVLTVGMAVDANVLIFERIREEVRNGNTPQASIHAGYEKALSSIADANITTLIAAVVLLTFGTGPIKGFAVVLSLGIVTSMFTAIIGTRAVINLIYGGRKVESLAV